MNYSRLLFGLCASLTIMLVACSPPATASPAAPTATVPAPTTTAAVPEAGGRLRWTVAPDGNEARYRVREQLVELTLPSDAVGATSAISGTLVLEADGTVVAKESIFVVDLTTLKSDRSRRDRFIQRNPLATTQFPQAEFAPTQVLGLPTPLPTFGEVTFQFVGDLTVHGVTRQTTWDVKAQVNGPDLVGNASTKITFADFEMQAPHVPVVLSVQESIGLEFDFHLVADT